MALDETTRQVNRRAVAALENTKKRLEAADENVYNAIGSMDDLHRYTNAHDPVLDDLGDIAARIRAAREDVARRWAAESEDQ